MYAQSSIPLYVTTRLQPSQSIGYSPVCSERNRLAHSVGKTPAIVTVGLFALVGAGEIPGCALGTLEEPVVATGLLVAQLVAELELACLLLQLLLLLALQLSRSNRGW